MIMRNWELFAYNYIRTYVVMVDACVIKFSRELQITVQTKGKCVEPNRKKKQKKKQKTTTKKKDVVTHSRNDQNKLWRFYTMQTATFSACTFSSLL